MDFYVTCGALGGKSIPDQDSGGIAKLSRLLKTLSANPPEAQGEKYRNPQGVYLKLCVTDLGRTPSLSILAVEILPGIFRIMMVSRVRRSLRTISLGIGQTLADEAVEQLTSMTRSSRG